MKKVVISSIVGIVVVLVVAFTGFNTGYSEGYSQSSRDSSVSLQNFSIYGVTHAGVTSVIGSNNILEGGQYNIISLDGTPAITVEDGSENILIHSTYTEIYYLNAGDRIVFGLDVSGEFTKYFFELVER